MPKQSFKLYALLGHPLGHSFSPGMHNAAFKKLGMKAHYALMDIPHAKLPDFLSGLKGLSFSGMNVTVPYKEKVIQYLDHCSQEVQMIGAVNTIVFKQGNLRGYNTDWMGFLDSLNKDLRCRPKGKSVLLLGAGGAGKACLYALCHDGAMHVTVSDLDQLKTCALLEQAKMQFPDTTFEVIKPKEIHSKHMLSHFDLVVNATSCGMKKSDPPLFPYRLLTGQTLRVYDVIYNPAETRLLKAAKKAGLPCANGLGMLLHQGARAFELWTSKKAPVAVMKKALVEQIT